MYAINRWHDAYWDLMRAKQRSHMSEKTERMIRAILADNEICMKLPPKRGTRCAVCGAKPRHPFRKFAHPHDMDHALVRRIAEIYREEDRSARAAVLIELAIEGALPPITEPTAPVSLNESGRYLRAVQELGAALRDTPDAREADRRVKALLKPLTSGYERTTPVRTKQGRDAMTERAFEMLRCNPALRDTDRQRIAVRLGEKFGVEDVPASDEGDTNQPA
jgi:hypothetical protein